MSLLLKSLLIRVLLLVIKASLTIYNQNDTANLFKDKNNQSKNNPPQKNPINKLLSSDGVNREGVY